MTTTASNSETLRVLVADDSDVDRALLARIVEREGHVVAQAVDGQDALQQFSEHRHDMVLLDALMPGIDGFEVARRIKEHAGTDFVPIIFLTALTEADALARAVDAGGDDFLSKPYNRVILRAKLAALQRMRAMHRTVQAQHDEISRHHAHLMRDQQAAKAIFDKIAHTGELDAPFIRYLVSPLAVFNGDVLLAARNPSDDLYLLLGDFTGHGLSAAVGAMPLAEIFYGMAHKGFAPGEILWQANRKMREILPSGYFCCVMLLSFNFRKHQVEYWNGGLPPGCLVGPGGGTLRHLASEHLPLGILDESRFDARTRTLDMAVGDKLIICTDGVIDARNHAGTEFGYARFDSILQAPDAASGAFDVVRRAVYDHIGSQGRDDDITLVQVTMPDPDSLPAVRPRRGAALSGSAEWRMCYELGPRSLREANPLPLLQQVLMDIPQLHGQAAAVHTVISELYSNALEHGVLGLDSRLKSSPDGFVAYYETRARELAALHTGSIRFDIDCVIDGLSGSLRVRVTDSGRGFDFRKLLSGGDPAQRGNFHGRGLRLVRALCGSLHYTGCGNEVEAVFRWGMDHERSA